MPTLHDRDLTHRINARHHRSDDGVSGFVRRDHLALVRAHRPVALESGKQAIDLWEATVPPGGGPPPHRHLAQDEAYYVLDGALEVLDGARLFTARAGDFVFIPRGTVHRFRNTGASSSRILIWMSPAGFEEFLFRVGRPARAGEQAPPLDADEIARSTAIAAEHGIEIVASTT